MKTIRLKLLGCKLLLVLVGLLSSLIAGNAATQVVVWGDNSSGQTNVPAGLTNVVAIAAGVAHSLVLKADGTALAWGSRIYLADKHKHPKPGKCGGDHSRQSFQSGIKDLWDGYSV